MRTASSRPRNLVSHKQSGYRRSASTSLRPKFPSQYGPCSSHTWGKPCASVPKCCTVGRNQFVWASYDGANVACWSENLSGVALVRPWPEPLKNSLSIVDCSMPLLVHELAALNQAPQIKLSALFCQLTLAGNGSYFTQSCH